jgi:hypothetical protein
LKMNGESTNTLTGVDIMSRIVGISHDGDSDCRTGHGWSGGSNFSIT